MIVLIEISIRMLRIFELLAAKIHEPLKADLTVAVESAMACFRGSRKIVIENLKHIQCSETDATMLEQLNAYQFEAESIADFFSN